MERDVLYYDGKCGLCRRSVRWLRALDWLGRLEGRDLTAVSKEDLPVRYDLALEGIPMRTRRGDVLLGFQAARRALVQTPAGLLPGGMLYLPGFSRLGEAIYKHVALNRRRELDSTCPLHGACGFGERAGEGRSDAGVADGGGGEARPLEGSGP